VAGRRHDDVGARLAGLAERYDLTTGGQRQLECLVGLLTTDRLAPTSITSVFAALDDHLADSLAALDIDAVRHATTALDLGSGAGLPGLPLAVAMPRTRFALLESSGRKCAFLERAVNACGVSNAGVVHARAESFADGFGRYELVTARAVAPLPVTLEYAAPLLRVGGTLVVWRGRRDSGAEAAARAAADALCLSQPEMVPVHPYPGAANRHLYLTSKVVETPSRFPRRPGMAAKRPLGSGRVDQLERGAPSAQHPSDRVQR
jgi:16S rRNA (guanine527-N7)-methyltransferase